MLYIYMHVHVHVPAAAEQYLVVDLLCTVNTQQMVLTVELVTLRLSKSTFLGRGGTSDKGGSIACQLGTFF